jgi:hypothetical protein
MDDNNGSQEPEGDNLFGPVIYRYTRAKALADGVLVDVSNAALEAGFKVPVALTRAAWDDCVEWTDEDTRRQTPQNESGRLWDVLWMAHCGIASLRRQPETGRSQERFPELFYRLFRVPRGGRAIRPREVTLKIVSGPGDNGEHVLTIMLPHED